MIMEQNVQLILAVINKKLNKYNKEIIKLFCIFSLHRNLINIE